MRSTDFIPNYYSYSLRLNGRELSNIQKEFFFSSVNKIYRTNDKFIYRGDKKTTLSTTYGIEADEFSRQFSHKLFVLGVKARMLMQGDVPGINELDIAGRDRDVFRLIFKMLSNLLQREFPFGTVRRAIAGFRSREEAVATFFRSQYNESIFVETINALPSHEQILIRDYYLALLHHISKSEYYNSSFLLSTTVDFSQAYKFAWKGEEVDSDNPLILFGWIPDEYEGILNVPNTNILKRKIDMGKLGLPIYEMTFFFNQKEVTLKGGLLPHYTLGYLYSDQQERDIFEINPALFRTDRSWNGKELPVDQNTFFTRIENTLYGRYFTLNPRSKEFSQNRI